MLRALLLGLARRMQRVGQQEQTGDEAGLLGTEHAGLTASVGVTAEINLPGIRLLHRFNGVLEAGPVSGCVAGAGRSPGAGLPVRQVAAQDLEAFCCEDFGQSYQDRGLCVPASAMREHEGVASRGFGKMKEAANFGFGGGIGKFADGGLGQESILNRAD